MHASRILSEICTTTLLELGWATFSERYLVCKNLFLQSVEDSTLGTGLTWSNFQKGWLITESISGLLATISYLLTSLLLVS